MQPVSTSAAYQSVLTQLLASENNEVSAQQQVSSGKLGDTLSGFGSQTGSLVATQSVMSRVTGLVSQLNQTSTQLTFQQTALTQISTIAQQLQTDLTEADGLSSGDNLMNQVQGLFSQAVSALNAQNPDGSYTFSGGQPTTQPFTAASMSDLTTQASVSSFFQNGNLAPVSRIDDNTTIQTGFTASTVGQSLMGIFQSIQAFQQGSTGSFGGTMTTAQQTFVESAISQLNAVVSATSTTAAQGGDIQNQVTNALTTQQARQTTLANRDRRYDQCRRRHGRDQPDRGSGRLPGLGPGVQHAQGHVPAQLPVRLDGRMTGRKGPALSQMSHRTTK
jgi:flagellar hook-associated protein 3 FlgL